MVRFIKLISIDQSTVKTGWAIFNNNEYIIHGLIDFHKVKDSDKRFKLMCNGIYDLLSENKAEIVVFEDVALQSNVSVLRLLAQLQGIIIGFCIKNNIPYFILKPSEWRKQLCFIQGRNIKKEKLKEQAISFAKETLHIDKISEDEADAVCIGLAYINKIKSEEIK